MEKFRKDPDERVLMEGSILWVQGEPGIVNELKRKYRQTNCKGILTSRRFVACSVPHGILSGIPIIWLVQWLRRGILFSIPLDNLVSITNVANSPFTMRVSDGLEYKVCDFWNNNQKWLQAITGAVVAADPGIKLQANGNLVEFKKA